MAARETEERDLPIVFLIAAMVLAVSLYVITFTLMDILKALNVLAGIK